jgi:hypothetical protein
MGAIVAFIFTKTIRIEEGDIMKRVSLAGCFVAIVILLVMLGCTGAQKGALVGGAVGAGSGALIGHQHHYGSGKGALVGAGIGALTGALVGDFVDNYEVEVHKKEKYPQPNYYDYYDNRP